MLAGVLSLAACAEPGQGRSLGTDLGTFSVAAAEADNDCGAGALGSRPRLSFDVELMRADTELFWDGSPGDLDADLGFLVSASTRFELRPADRADPGCTITRTDTIAGALLADAGGIIIAFDADMSFAFQTEPDAACTPRELDEADLHRVPCSMSYALDGQRTRAPEP